MKISKEEYKRLAEKLSPPSPLLKHMAGAFLTGGLLCTLAQLIKNTLIKYGAAEKNAAALTTCSLIFLGVLLTDLGLFGKIASFAGAGTLVPVTGFANSVASPALEFRTEGIITGSCVKMFTIAGPVLVCGITASVIYGLMLLFLPI